MTLRPAALAAVLVFAACGGGSKPSSPAASDWVDVPGMICGDGSPTGIAISRARSDAVLVYLSPGGACWSAARCDAEFKSFGRDQLELYRPSLVPGTILDPTLAGNPFSDWTIVFIPYCTGDVHSGDAVQDYGGSAGVWQHHGYRNLQAAVGAFTAALPTPARVVVAGSSAGGFGALAAYDLVRSRWGAPATTPALLDDSGPTFDASGIATSLLARWWDVWRLDQTIGVSCPGCAGDLSLLWSRLHATYPDDRLALASATQDAEMIGFFSDPSLGVGAQTGGAYEANLAALATTLASLGPEVATYRVGGDFRTEHALLVDRYFLGGAQGPAFLSWVSAMVALDPSWASSTSR